MLIETRRFGLLDVTEEQVLTIDGPVPPFDSASTYVLLPHRVGPPFNWLQSIDEDQMAFIVTQPSVFFPWYRPALPAVELDAVGASCAEDVLILAILTPRKDEGIVSANLLAPLIIGRRTGRGRQVVLQGSGYHTRHPLVVTGEACGVTATAVRAAGGAEGDLRATA